MRASQFFMENSGKLIHRVILQTLLFDQRDYMKRLRGNGGARDVLGEQSVDLLSTKFDRVKVRNAGFEADSPDFFIALKRPN